MTIKSNNVLKTVCVMTTIAMLGACTAGTNDTPTPLRPVVPEGPPPEPTLAFTASLPAEASTGANALLAANPGGPGGSPNQSLRAGDILVGDEANNILIGGLGVDILRGMAGNDVLIGGTEDFNSSVDGDGNGSDNRDRAFGGEGDDVFIWAPGDGSDFFHGGPGTDVLIFGVIGEAADADGATEGAPFFNVNPPSGSGSQDFDGISLTGNFVPTVRSSNSPGFCTIVDAVTNRDQIEALNLNHIILFSLRGIANAFDAGEQADDDGLRVAVSTADVEFLVCTRRDFDDTAGTENIEVFDISGEVPVISDIESLPAYVQELII